MNNIDQLEIGKSIHHYHGSVIGNIEFIDVLNRQIIADVYVNILAG